ncbi:MAG: hypothetical protein RR646_06080 [Erysipelotrichaceae bacterium]
MAIFDILSGMKDSRSEEPKCSFNGYLEDYLLKIEDEEELKEEYDLLSEIFKIDDSLKIAKDLALNINVQAIANQIIRYKDSFKLSPGTIKIPYIIYGNFNNVQRAIILVKGERKEYVNAKALYYLMSEPDNEFEGTSNEVVAMNFNKTNIKVVVEMTERFFNKLDKAGNMQRSLDRIEFASFKEMYEEIVRSNKIIKDDLNEQIINSSDANATINGIIAQWFLYKKFTYVQYMMDKNLLRSEHENNVKKQRQKAKELSDGVDFISFSELWKIARNN